MSRRQKPIIKNYIFDFDGTLADSLPAIIAVFNKRIRPEEDPLNAEEVERLRGMTSRKAIKNLGIRWWQVPKFLLMGMGDFRALVPTLKSFAGLPDTIAKLYANGANLYIVTSNTKDNVQEFLVSNNLDKYFTDMETAAGLFRKAKHIRKLMKRNGLKRKETIYIGDETRDVKAARLAMIKVASVTWGFNNPKILKRQRPTYLVDRPKQLLEINDPKE